MKAFLQLFTVLDPTSLISITSLLILLTASALISGAEVAMFSLTKLDLNEKSKSSRLKIVEKLLRKPKKLLATILVANNFINIAIVLLFSSLGDKVFANNQSEINLYFFSLNFVFFIKVVVVTFLILLIGEILPKVYANRNNIKFACFMAHPLSILDFLLSPITTPMQNTIVIIHRKFGNKKTTLSVDQLSQALELTNSENTSSQEQKILEGIVSFGNTDTKQVMRPRIDIFALDKTLKFNVVKTEILKNGYSRIPVYENNLDAIVGVLYVKDLIPHISNSEFDWNSLIRDPFFVPENKKLDDLMVEFQEKKVHLAVVVDEYGGTSGIISLEDIIEEIVGDISDEFDDDDLIYSKINDNNYVFEGKTALKDFYRIIKTEDESVFELAKGEAETMAGFVLEISKSFPKLGAKINFHNLIFKIEALDKKRIKQIKVTIK